jgi:hypothetical protein
MMASNAEIIGTYERPAHGWTCFHCGETFTTPGGARDHFGADPTCEPGCIMKVRLGGERGMLMELRRQEAEYEKLRIENETLEHLQDSVNATFVNQLRRDLWRRVTCQQRLILVALRCNPKGLSIHGLQEAFNLDRSSRGTIMRSMRYLIAQNLVTFTTANRVPMKKRDYVATVYFAVST